ncbi:MAG: NAD(P)/FAD-dependent oxidoreductase [Pirellulales bacterium]|nr:NAD(P)/FAD-dependent oxidoreductase [Pirellulales bacterium]
MNNPSLENARTDSASDEWDVAVLGAGAAGLVAALRAAERGRRTILLEKNKRPGIKILMSGGTRCNITQATDNRGIVRAYGASGKFLHSALAALSVQSTIALFEAEGVKTKVETTGKVFPDSDRAADVLGALLDRLRRSGAVLALEEPCQSLAADAHGFLLTTSRRTLIATSVVVTTGGRSYPGSGTTGDGYPLARGFGHTIVPTCPALVPLTTRQPWVASLRGITLPDVWLRIREGDRTLAERRSSLLFAHFGLTGPAALDVSRVVSRHPHPTRLVAEIDLLPDRREDVLSEELRLQAAAAGKRTVGVILATWIPHRLADEVLRIAQIPPERRGAELAKPERGRLAATLKRLVVPLEGTLGFKKAEVTAGGVSLDEVDSKTMQSKLQPGLYFAGEVLDLDGPIGGYNFQAAWSTGWLAGSHA